MNLIRLKTNALNGRSAKESIVSAESKKMWPSVV
jgi:hypothetical protein